ncbi:MAG TPA: COX15/CtaA family protein [Bryobacteraceae bacterium]|nr:COX15/CtaA family protein [Bryobacteraceae bacterium]
MAHALADARAESSPAVYRRFSRVAWGVLAYNMLVVLWGAFVRATGSGAGCGNRWPLCNGVVVPRAASVQTIIEFTHRVMSGVAILGVCGLCLWAFLLFPRGRRARLFAALSAVFLFAEALLGAGLVLFRYVEHNASAGRAVYLSAHLVNTQILLAMLALTAWFGAEGASRRWHAAPRVVMAALPVAVIVAVSGAIAALGDTLFPARSVSAGIHQEFAANAAALLRMRALHPVIAALGSAVVLMAAITALRSPRPAAVHCGYAVALLLFVQLAAGVINIFLLAPVWMQITHLLIADLLWISLVVTALETGRA